MLDEDGQGLGRQGIVRIVPPFRGFIKVQSLFLVFLLVISTEKAL